MNKSDIKLGMLVTFWSGWHQGGVITKLNDKTFVVSFDRNNRQLFRYDSLTGCRAVAVTKYKFHIEIINNTMPQRANFLSNYHNLMKGEWWPEVKPLLEELYKDLLSPSLHHDRGLLANRVINYVFNSPIPSSIKTFVKNVHRAHLASLERHGSDIDYAEFYSYLKEQCGSHTLAILELIEVFIKRDSPKGNLHIYSYGRDNRNFYVSEIKLPSMKGYTHEVCTRAKLKYFIRDYKDMGYKCLTSNLGETHADI